jgi:hypothetical protein
VAIAGFVTGKIQERILETSRAHDSFRPRLASMRSQGGKDFVVYGCLEKNFVFTPPFKRLAEPMVFGGARVRAFGAGKTAPNHELPDVSVCDYQGKDDFVIQWNWGGDRVLLAKMRPQATLQETVAWARGRASHSGGVPLGPDDLLIVPQLSIDVSRHYAEIENHWLAPPGHGAAKDLFLTGAFQSVRFEMNSPTAAGRSPERAAASPAIKRRMVFDKPFLVVIERNGTETPYFVLWVDNPLVLVKW